MDLESSSHTPCAGLIHARKMHPAFYDPTTLRPSATGIRYLLPIFTNAIGQDDLEALRTDLFDESHLALPYHSVNTDINKRIKYLSSGVSQIGPAE